MWIFTSCWFSFKNSVVNLTVAYFSDMTNMGVPYSNLCTGMITPILDRHISSFLKVSLLTLVTG